MVNCNKGSPDSEHTDGAPNYMTGANEIDEIDEEGGYNGYEPLGMHDYEDDLDNDSEEGPNEDVPESNSDNSSTPPIEPIENALVREVWTGPNPTDIPLDENKIDEIKELMKEITLPMAALPDWVTNDALLNSLMLKTKQTSK